MSTWQKWLQVISAKVMERRLAAGMTQEQLAKKSGLPLDFIQRVEAGEHSPGNKARAKMADALGVHPRVFSRCRCKGGAK